MKYGIKGNKNDVMLPNYSTWGLCGGTMNCNQISTDELNLVYKIPVLIDVNITGYYPVSVTKVPYYQGEILPSANALLLRYERNDGKNHGLAGEHISVVYNLQYNALLGYTCMQSHLNNEACVSHQQALQTAINFMKKIASDLIPNETEIPKLNELESSERIEFEPAISIGNVELHWIDGHYEHIIVAGVEKRVHGMKVKFFIPNTGLWAWVIIGKDNEVVTFERNVSWDFLARQRQTQMWLHDRWLAAQGVALIKI